MLAECDLVVAVVTSLTSTCHSAGGTIARGARGRPWRAAACAGGRPEFAIRCWSKPGCDDLPRQRFLLLGIVEDGQGAGRALQVAWGLVADRQHRLDHGLAHLGRRRLPRPGLLLVVVDRLFAVVFLLYSFLKGVRLCECLP